jgi:hypothetical protein
VRHFSVTLTSLAVSLVFIGVAHAEAVNIDAVVAKKAAIIRNMHDKAARAIVQVAQDPAFSSYFAGPQAHGAENLKQRIDHISLSVQSNFHVEEMCLIDATGSEVSRIVRDQIAYDLSTEEADNAFFRPSFQQKRRTTYIAPAYISPDVHKWVMAYTTPIEVEGHNKAILHYEHGLDVYQAALNKEPATAGAYVVAVDRHGFVFADSRKAIPVDQRGEVEDPALYFEPFSLAGKNLDEVIALLGNASSGTINGETGSYQIAYREVADWTIVGVVTTP